MLKEIRINWIAWTGLLGPMVILLQACAVTGTRVDGPPRRPIDVSSIPNAVPRQEPRSRFGNPESYVVNGEKYRVLKSSTGYVQLGIASWYGRKFHGRRTSSGEPYDMYAMTAAHKTLPLPTYVEVTNLGNGRKVIVRVNDRGPFHVNRIIDLSYAAAYKLGMLRDGTALVKIRAIDPGAYRRNMRLAKSNKNKGISGFYLQVGAFSSYDNAVRLKNRLAGLADGLIHISKASVKGRRLYRVRFGPIIDVNRADRIVIDLNHYGIDEHHIMIDL